MSAQLQPQSGFRVERTYQNFISDTSRTEMLPKVYKTLHGAEMRAQANRWTTMPDRYTRIDAMSARVLRADGGAL